MNRSSRHLVFFIVLLFLSANAEGADPKILLFGSDVEVVLPDSHVTFSAIVTDPDGIETLVGGVLETTDGKHQYGVFATSAEEGAYSLTLSWNQINRVKTINFENELAVEIRARFFDSDGNSTSTVEAIILDCSKEWHHAENGACRAREYEGALDLNYSSPLVFHNDLWKGICGIPISTKEVSVMCRQLGFSHGILVSMSGGAGGEGHWIGKGDLVCNGDEDKISDCELRWGGLCTSNWDPRIKCTK